MSAVRLLHFSDIHLPPSKMGWRIRDIFSKSITGWVNMRLLGRARRFRNAGQVLEHLLRHLEVNQPDALVFSGDATHMGFESEFVRVSRALKGYSNPATKYIAVPGNHDHYTHQSVRQSRFERHFKHWQTGLRIGDHAYPFAQNVNGLWLIAVNSATPNWLPGDATGAIGHEQLHRLQQLNEQLGPGRRVLVTHYPLRGLDGKPEHRLRVLRDHDKALEVAKQIGVSLWLHGHIHRPFYHSANQDVPFPTICNGSTCQTDRLYFHEYVFEPTTLRAIRYQFDLNEMRFTESLRFELPLRSLV